MLKGIIADFKGEKTSKNDSFVKYVSENILLYTIDQIRKKARFLKKMEDKGEIKIGIYNLKDGTL